MPPGTYYVSAKDNYTGETIQINSSFAVPAPVVPEVPGPSGPGGAYVQKQDFSVEAPDSVSLYTGTNRSFLIKVTNTGEATLRRLTLIVSQTGIGARSTPATTDLDTNSSVFFFVEVDAAETMEGQYELEWNVFTGLLNRTGTVHVVVMPYMLRDECLGSVTYYMGIMEKLRDQLLALEMEGRNVSYARQLYEDAMYNLMAAQTYGEIDDYESCVDRMSHVTRNIEIIVVELAHAKTEPLLVILPVIYQVVAWSLASVVVAIVLIIAVRRLLRHYNHHIRKSRFVLPKDWN